MSKSDGFTEEMVAHIESEMEALKADPETLKARKKVPIRELMERLAPEMARLKNEELFTIGEIAQWLKERGIVVAEYAINKAISKHNTDRKQSSKVAKSAGNRQKTKTAAPSQAIQA